MILWLKGRALRKFPYS